MWVLSAHGWTEDVGIHESIQEECEDKETERGTQGTHHLVENNSVPLMLNKHTKQVVFFKHLVSVLQIVSGT